jgi:hypothetical protein
MMRLSLVTFLAAAHAAVPGDLVTSLPGFGPPPTPWYSGYLSFTGVNDARLHMHYVFQQSPNPSTDPVTVWFNGGVSAAACAAFPCPTLRRTHTCTPRSPACTHADFPRPTLRRTHTCAPRSLACTHTGSPGAPRWRV